MKARSLALALSVLSGCGGGSASTTTGAPAGSHAIRLTRTLAVGATWGEVTHYASQQREVISAGTTVVRDTANSSVIEIAGDYSILALGPDGQPSRLRLAIDRATLDVGTGASPLPVPAVIVITPGTPGTITGENGEAIAEETVEQLRHVLPDQAHPADDDAVFGTREPQPVGASWPIDPRGTAHGLAALQLTVDPSNVGGSTTLVSAGNEQNVDVLTLRTELNASHIGFPGLPPGSVEQRADVHATIEVVLPSDTAIVPLRETEQTNVDIEVLVPTETGGSATVDVTIREQVEHTRTPR